MTSDCNKPDEKPCSCDSDAPKKTRRDFLLMAGIGLNVVAGAMMGIPLLGYLLSSAVRKYPLQPVSLGLVDSFPEGKTRFATFENPYHREWDGQSKDIPCWVRRVKGNEFQIFAINCTHLGCPVRWFEESKLFMCPCHGGVFYEDGSHAAGPPPRGLYEYVYEIQDNKLMIQAGVMPNLSNTLKPI